MFKNKATQANSDRILGLDSIRMVCALWVVFSHFGFIPFFDLSEGGGVWVKVFHGVCNNLFCGVAAVIVFFLISGFCIHYPFRNSAAVPVAEFLARRYLRIGLPLAVVYGGVLIWHSTEAAGFYNSILWSLVAELIYYTIYPLLFPFIKKWGWKLAAGAYVVAFGVISHQPDAKNYHEFGAALTWVVGLPCWLLGCMLAAQFSRSAPPPKAVSLYLLRSLIWCLASLSSTLRFHSSIGYPWSLSCFAMACYFWLRAELNWFQTHPPNRALERAGAWSYSLYLCHVPVFFALASLLEGMEGQWESALLKWILEMAAGLFASYLFSLVVEYPAHRLARLAGQTIRHRRWAW